MILSGIGLVAGLMFHDFLVLGAALLTALYVVGYRLFLRRLETSIAEAHQKNEQLAQL